MSWVRRRAARWSIVRGHLAGSNLRRGMLSQGSHPGPAALPSLDQAPTSGLFSIELMIWKWREGFLTTCAIAAAGCGQDHTDSQPVQSRLALESFDSCEALEEYIEDTAVREMRSSIEQYERNYRFGVPSSGAAEDAGAGGVAAPSHYTQTNTQVAGVDEPDFVKNDGTRMFVLSGNTLYLNRSWPAADLATVGTYQVEGWPRDMFLAENDRVVIFSGIASGDTSHSGPWMGSGAVDLAPCADLGCGSFSDSVKVTVLDVRDLAMPRVEQQYYLPGGYANARRIGAVIRLVLSDQVRWPAALRWYPDEQSYGQLIEENEKKIRAQSLSDWLPPIKRKTNAGTEEEIAYRCSDFYKSNAPTRLGLATVATLNLDASDGIARTTIVAEAGEIYASPRNLYLASPHWWSWPEPGQTDYTYLHKFDITQPDRALYVGSGGVEGVVVDQFAMDENAEGFLRVATTISRRIEDPVDERNEWGIIQTTNRVSVLGEIKGRLEVVGKTPELAPGERIYSARMLGKRGFVVTFRQVDPFFTLDLSDPSDPKQLGELKIPGFSTYLHPIGQDHVLAIGSYISPDDVWSSRAIKLSLFDVSNFREPKEQSSILVGSSSASSEAQYDHRAFNYFSERALLAIPFVDWSPSDASGTAYWSSFVSELRLFHVDTVAGITARGALSMSDVFTATQDSDWRYYWLPQVRRSVMADDFVFAISDAGIRVSNISTPSLPMKTIVFQKSTP